VHERCPGDPMGDTGGNTAPMPTPVEMQAAKGQFGLAERLLLKNNYADAIQLMRESLRLDPANLAYRRALRRTEQLAVKNGSGWLGRATLKTKCKMAKLSQVHMQVLELGEAILAQDPDDVQCQLDMAESANALGLQIVAMWILEHARQRGQNDAVNLALASLYEHAGRYANAIALLQQISTNNTRRCELQQKIKDLMASESIRRAFDAPPGDAQPMNDTAEMTVAGATETEPPAAPAVVDRQARDVEKLRSQIASDPASVNAHLALVAYWRRAGNLQQCADAIREGLAATNNHAELGLEQADLDIERQRQALAELETRIKADPKNAAFHENRNALLQAITAAELKFFKQKIRVLPGDTGAHFELGVRLYRSAKYQEAVQELQGTREAPRFQWQSLAYLGLSFERLSVWRLAQRNFKDALAKIPAAEIDWRKRILFHLAKGSAEAGELDQAIELGFELANVDFTYRQIDQLLALWQKQVAAKPESGES
jgi:tetratricopeptide (TPR) repeat protein